jgi:serine/threonine protein kinase
MASRLPELPTGVAEGEVLAGKYRIGQVIGGGGMGVVVSAVHVGLDERVAIKFLLPELLENTQAVKRFAREARAAVKIKSEHVARILDVGQLEGGAPYMVMEHLEGGDLSAWLRQRGPLDPSQAVEFILQACEAIAEAHVLGIVHRDLKPANLFCVRRPDGLLSVKVLDFGISKVTGEGSALDLSATKKGSWVGSPLYMAPEQMQSANDVDARADIWALGAILYELVAGAAPFDGDTMPELVYSVVHAPHLPLRHVCPEAPAELDFVVGRCLKKDRAKRYSNVAALALDLGKLAPERAQGSVARISRTIGAAGLATTALSLPPSGGPGTPLASASTIEMEPWGESREVAKSTPKGGKVAIVATLGVAICVVAGAVTLRTQVAPPPPPPAAVVAPAPSPSPSPEPVPVPVPATAPPAVSTEPTLPKAPAPRPPLPTPLPLPRASDSSAPKSAPRCDPPYFFDGQGNRVFKKECL